MLKVGILGAAAIAPAAIIDPARRRSDVEVTAIASRGIERARAFAAQHDIPTAYGSYEELLADPAVDLVYVALPPSAHAEWSIAALQAGKDVLCEKPFALNGAEARAMTEAATATGRRLVEAFHDHYHPLAARTKVLARTLGRLISVEGVFVVRNSFEPGALRHEPALGGGAMMDLGVYPLHGIRHLVDEEPVGATAVAQLNPAGADDSIEAELAFPSGVTGLIRASMSGDLENWVRVVGERGELRVDGVVFPSKGHSILYTLDGVERTETVAGRSTYDHQLEALVDGLATGQPLPTEGQDSVLTMEAVDRIYEAAGVRRP
jgi:predicted dehydrogenase